MSVQLGAAVKRFTIPSKRGAFPLAISSFPCPGSTTTALIAPATGVPRYFYDAFCGYLNRAGISALSFDYRLCGGRGGSWEAGVNSSVKDERIQALREAPEVSISREWREDYETVLDYCQRTSGGQELVVVGHSLGGHLLQIVDNSHLVSRTLWLGVVNPYLEYSSIAAARRVVCDKKIKEANEIGYFRSSTIGQGNDIPSGAGIEWFEWSKREQYMHDQDALLLKFKVPVYSIAFSDDAIAERSPRITDSILEYIPAPATRIFADPETMGWSPCGHVNSFLPIHEKTVWPIFLDYIRSGKKMMGGGEVREFAAGRVGGPVKL